MSKVFYECQRCGNCCRWPGFVKLLDDDIVRMADFFKISVGEFNEKYTELHPSRQNLVLLNKPNGECIFFDASTISCQVQAAKPRQCIGFPNTWNFPDWEKSCEAIPRDVSEEEYESLVTGKKIASYRRKE